jgi:hypothetical protein
MGKGKAKGWRPPRDDTPAANLLFGSADHLTGDSIASPVQLREERKPLPKNHLNYSDHDSKGKWKGSGGAGAGKGDGKNSQAQIRPPVPPFIAPSPKQAAVKKEEVKADDVKKEPTVEVKQELTDDVKAEEAAKAQRMIDAKTEIERRREAMLAREKAVQSNSAVDSGEDAEARRRTAEARRKEAEANAREAEARRREALAASAAEIKRSREAEVQEDVVDPVTAEPLTKRLRMEGDDTPLSGAHYTPGSGGYFASRGLLGVAATASASSTSPCTASEPAIQDAASIPVPEEAACEDEAQENAAAPEPSSADDAPDAGACDTSAPPAELPSAKPSAAADEKPGVARTPAASASPAVPKPTAAGAVGLQRWAARVNALADTNDPDMVKRCRDFVRQRILKAHATGDLHSNVWEEEPLPDFATLCGGS